MTLFELEENLDELEFDSQTDQLEAAKQLIDKAIDILEEANTGDLKS